MGNHAVVVGADQQWWQRAVGTRNHAGKIGEIHSIDMIRQGKSFSSVGNAADFTESTIDPCFGNLVSLGSNHPTSWLAEFINVILE